MKKVDAAAAAELRLVKATWVPEILTDREIPAAPSWHIHDDEDEDDGDNTDAGNGASETQGGEDGDAEPDECNGGENVNNTPREADASPDTRSKQPPWPFPTATSVSTAQADRHVV
jgi:ParB family transcriptional regulator, chromosome partitioning protein